MTGRVKIYSTLGPACGSVEILKQMFEEGMTGARLNLSHVTLEEAAGLVETYHQAAAEYAAERGAGAESGGQEFCPELLIDMQGPELRIGRLDAPIEMKMGEAVEPDDIPFLPEVLEFIADGHNGTDILLDDGKIMLRTELGDASEADAAGSGGDANCTDLKLRVIRGGVLESKKSVAVKGLTAGSSAVTEDDLANIKVAKKYGVTGLMQPFVRGAKDLLEVRRALDEAGCEDVRLFGKVESLEGMAALDEIIPHCDEVIIARGDLGNSMDLWELPAAQKQIAYSCRKAGRDFTVVTQMLDSMIQRQVPTRAEVSDIFNAVLDGARSVMLTGETATGENPVLAIRYMARTVREAEAYLACNSVQ